jgi:hypothetical protein
MDSEPRSSLWGERGREEEAEVEEASSLRILRACVTLPI